MHRHVRIHLLTYLGSICVCMWQLNNRLFEELAMDVYDEVDRRENDAGEPHFSSSPVCFSGGFSPIWKLAVIIEIENTSTRHHWHEKKRWRRKREKNCRESRCWEDREGIWKTECYRGRPNGVSEWGRRRDGVRKCLQNSWGAFLLLLGSFSLFLALSPSLFPFLLPIPFSSGSSQIVVSYRSTTGKWQGYKDTHTHRATHKGRAQSITADCLEQDSALRATAWFLTVLCLCLFACVGG